MQIIFMYIQNHYVKNNYMPLHKLNQAKNTSYQLKKKKIYVHFQMSLFFLSISPFTNPRYARTHRRTHLCTSCSHWNIQTNKCLFGWCEAVAPCSARVYM